MSEAGTGAQGVPEASESMTLEDAQRIIRELRKENADRRVKAKEAETRLQEREQQDMAAKQEWEKLASQYKSELDAVKSRASVADELEADMRETLEAQIKALPRQFQSSIPDLGSPARTLKWLNANRHLFQLPTPPQTNAGEQGDRGPAPLSDDMKTLAAGLGISAEKMAEYARRKS
ncbi:MAG: hypothetical protein EBR82_34515 [Caulobacteraceae bacterium]|nr:hypothetical protein [Caulobacteraceae bacterium]